MNDLLALGSELIARLRTGLPPEAHVLSAADLASVTEERQLTPAVHVVYQGYRPLENGATGQVVRIEQTWLVVVTTRNVRALASGSATRLAAGELSAAVLRTLLGFKAASATKPLQLSNAPPARYTAGAQYLPLAFAAEMVVRAAST